MNVIPAKRIKIAFRNEPTSAACYIHMGQDLIGRRHIGYSVFQDAIVGDGDRLHRALENATSNWGREADIEVEEFDYAPTMAVVAATFLLKANDLLRRLGIEEVTVPGELPKLG